MADNENENHDMTYLSGDNVIRFARREKPGAPGGASEPMINLPPATKIMLGLFLGIHVVTNLLLDPPQEYWAIMHFGFVPAYFTGDHPFIWPMIAGPFTYMLLHGSWLHVLLNTAMMTAFGAGCERMMGARRMMALFVLCSLAAAATHLAVAWGSNNPVIGASGGISGLFAATMMILTQKNPGALGNGRYGLWPFIALWIGISVIFGMMGGPDGSVIAWAAHIGGFIGGFVFYPLVMRIKA